MVCTYRDDLARRVDAGQVRSHTIDSASRPHTTDKIVRCSRLCDDLRASSVDVCLVYETNVIRISFLGFTLDCVILSRCCLRRQIEHTL
jgi:hypothetical protein